MKPQLLPHREHNASPLHKTEVKLSSYFILLIPRIFLRSTYHPINAYHKTQITKYSSWWVSALHELCFMMVKKKAN